MTRGPHYSCGQKILRKQFNYSTYQYFVVKSYHIQYSTVLKSVSLLYCDDNAPCRSSDNSVHLGHFQPSGGFRVPNFVFTGWWHTIHLPFGISPPLCGRQQHVPSFGSSPFYCAVLSRTVHVHIQYFVLSIWIWMLLSLWVSEHFPAPGRAQRSVLIQTRPPRENCHFFFAIIDTDDPAQHPTRAPCPPYPSR